MQSALASPAAAGVESPSFPGAPGQTAGHGSTLALTLTLAFACFLAAMAALLLVVHPSGSGYLARVVIGQRQSAKTALYLGAFVVILPAALLAGPRLARRIAVVQGSRALGGLSALLAATLAGAVVLVRVLPVSHGLGTLLAFVCGWWLLAGVALACTLWPRPRRWRRRVGTGLARAQAVLWPAAGLAVLGALLCVTDTGALSPLGLGVGAAAAGAALLAAWRGVALPRAGRLGGTAVDALAIVLLLLAIPNLVVFHASAGLPSVYYAPGVIQFQQDWILGPANQLLGGGALLVGDPTSQYGVGLVYFLAGWFHLAPIGYGTFGLLDGILTALVYIAGYCALRIAGVARALAVPALGLAVAVLIYHLQFGVGALPEQGPLRFGLPIGVIVAELAAARWPLRAPAWHAVALVVLGVASIWAVEAFAYTAFTYLVLIAAHAWLRPRGARARWWAARAGVGLAACVAVHVMFALATLAGTGQLPDWSQYLAYVHGLLLGGREGAITYAFASFSPALAVGAGCLASAAALVLMAVRAPELLARHRLTMLALAGFTAYAIASFSYSDNRSSTYLLPYMALPLLLAGALWLALLWREGEATGARLRLAGLAAALAVSVLMLGAAWPTIGSRFSDSALAHAHPGGGMRAALHRLWHPPAIDPRAPAAQRLLARWIPGRRALIVFPTAPDLGIEALIRSHRSSPLYLGDPSQEVWIPSVWKPRISAQIDRLPVGGHVLLDTTALRVITRLRGLPADYALEHPVLGGNPELEWILHRLDARFRLVPVTRDRATGMVVATLGRR